MRQPLVNIMIFMPSMKPILADEYVIRYVTTYECPNCGKHLVGNGLLNYCYHCGQKLDWSDEMDGEK